MSNNQSTNNTKPKFNEYQAYEALRMIFVIAIETQDFSTIEARISAWEKKYPLAEFTNPEIIRKIKEILNKDFLSRLMGDYLATKILHEQEKQKEAYDSLKSIIDKAKRSKDYKTAEKEIRKWKDNLHSNGFNLYSFDRLYRAKVCTLLLLPSKELENQEKATDELKQIKENGTSMNSTDYFEAITNWQNKYSISKFPDKLKKELNQITTEVFDSISQKRTSENAILEIENMLSSKATALPADAIASILSKYDYRNFDADAVSRIKELSMEAFSIQEAVLNNGIPNIDLSALTAVSPAEAQALTSLRDILNKTPHDMDTILNWIYVNRKINYSEFARESIVKQFASVGYNIPSQNSYAIPDINFNLNYQNFSRVDDLRKSVILNYLGIISQGSKLSIEEKANLSQAHAVSVSESLTKDDTKKPTMFLEAFDTMVEEPEEEKLYNGKNEEAIYNIFIEDIIDNPLATYSIIPTASSNKSITTDTVLNSPATSTASSSSQEIAITDNIGKEHEIKAPTSSKSTSSKSSLTIKDENNLEQAYELSTYVVVATPILEQALQPKLERGRKKAEKIKD